jgi:hypothetical protein
MIIGLFLCFGVEHVNADSHSYTTDSTNKEVQTEMGKIEFLPYEPYRKLDFYTEDDKFLIYLIDEEQKVVIDSLESLYAFIKVDDKDTYFAFITKDRFIVYSSKMGMSRNISQTDSTFSAYVHAIKPDSTKQFPKRNEVQSLSEEHASPTTYTHKINPRRIYRVSKEHNVTFYIEGNEKWEMIHPYIQVMYIGFGQYMIQTIEDFNDMGSNRYIYIEWKDYLISSIDDIIRQKVQEAKE